MVKFRCWFLFALSISFLFLFYGCVTKKVDTSSGAPVFYPPQPNPPRYQFLTAFRSTDDFAEEVSGLDSFLGATKRGYTLKKPYGVAMASGNMYVVDTQSSVFRFDFNRRKIHKIAGDKGLGKLVQPINVSLDSQGNKYVADPVRSAVIEYDKNDFFVRSFVSPDPWKPVDAEVYEGRLYVIDSTHATGGVKVFDLETGEFLEHLGQSGSPEHRLKIPTNMTFDSDGYMYIMDAGRFQIVKYDRDGHYRGHLGDPGDSPGYFGRPRGVAVDKAGRIYAVDAAFDVVQVFSANGQVLTFIGGPGTAPGTLTLPAGVFIDYDDIKYFQKYAAPGFSIEYLIFVTSQFHDTNGISVYAYGKMEGMEYPSDDELRDQLLEEIRRKEDQ